MKILFKYPTRNRPEWFKKTLQRYCDFMSNKELFHFTITLDEDDESMNNEHISQWLKYFPLLDYKYGKHESKVEACNADIDLTLDWDILVLVSDDMIPVVKGFDSIIVQKMKQYFPDTDGALHFSDGFEGDQSNITLSIMGRKLYERIGYVYHPAYKSFFCDKEFTDVVYKMEKVMYFPEVIIKHIWSGGPHSKDALYQRNSKMGKGDKKTYDRRKLLDFPNESWGTV